MKITEYKDLPDEYTVLHKSIYKMDENDIYDVAIDVLGDNSWTMVYIIRHAYIDMFIETLETYFPQCCLDFYFDSFILYESGDHQWTPPFQDKWHIQWIFRNRYITTNNLTIYEDVV